MHLLALIVPTAFALVFYALCLQGATFLSDDYLLVSLMDPRTGGVQWSEIGSSFSEGWFLSGYWRPLVSLSYGINIALLGFTPGSLYAVNLLLHLVAVAATAELCYRLGSRDHPAIAGSFGGMFMAIYPFSAEPVLWIAARTTGLEVCFRICAVLAFAAYLRSRRKTTYGLVFLFSALALAAKESAVVLPVYLLFVDLLDSPRRPGRERLLLHAPLFVLWVAYAILRLVIFGSVLGVGAPQAGADEIPGVLGQKLAMLIAPDILTGIAWVVVGATAVSLAWGRLKPLVLLLGLGFLCLLVSLAPTYNVPLGEGTVGVRMLYGSLPVLAVVVCRCLFIGSHRTMAQRRRREVVAYLPVVLGGLALFTQVGHYQASWAAMRTAEVQIAKLGESVDASRPLGLVSVPPCPKVPGPTNPVSYLAFARRPFTPKPFAIVGLGFLITPPPVSAELINDPRPIHALLKAGCPVAAWSQGKAEQDGEMRSLHKDTRATPGRFAAGVVTFDPPRSLATIEHIRIRAIGTATGGRIPQLDIRFSGSVQQGNERVFHVDVSRDGALLRDILAGRELSELKVELEGGGALDVQVNERLPRLELGSRFDGAPLAVKEWKAPASKHTAPMMIVLLGEATGFTWSVEPGKQVIIPAGILDVMRILEHRLEARRYHYYFQTTAPQGSSGSARSDLDWFLLDENGG